MYTYMHDTVCIYVRTIWHAVFSDKAAGLSLTYVVLQTLNDLDAVVA